MGITLKKISYQYKDQFQKEKRYAIQDISLTLEKGEYAALIGHSGSGKSTLLQHLNGLLRPDEGEYYFDGNNVWDKTFSLQKLRQKVALCFQYPEYQLFEETVLKDICFGPKNLGFDPPTCEEKARKAMELTGISPDLEDASPFALSGGQKRRVALSGILAMEPEYLILDEPVAGLDGKGKENLFSLLRYLNEEKKITILLVSHDMDDVAANARRVLVMNQGRLVMDDTTDRVFAREADLEAMGLALPQPLVFFNRLKRDGYFSLFPQNRQKGERGTAVEPVYSAAEDGSGYPESGVSAEKSAVEKSAAEKSTAEMPDAMAPPLTVQALAERILEVQRCFGK